jgi:hypothetical protein
VAVGPLRAPSGGKFVDEAQAEAAEVLAARARPGARVRQPGVGHHDQHTTVADPHIDRQDVVLAAPGMPDCVGRKLARDEHRVADGPPLSIQRSQQVTRGARSVLVARDIQS